ncbi:hypothetical protein HNQ94_003340 [Salirhabdus euzebyi]|uniref:Calcineurin-like phosphoesterase domain-containing protein n=1 Tax=Salirhabdus euzebyi TaxID=394506 RepID=A0A841Q8R3_9BACI|nr:metallophosphoesterase [Salirhabdus euzebyi]MBB6454851.1 hypothetical protein [Salirhabdus euzebyi]
MARKSISRRSFLKRFIYSFFGLFGVGGGTYYYAKHIEPSLINVKREKIVSPKIPQAFDGFNILLFGDTHLGFHYTLDQLNDLITEINSQKPDLVLFTGDLVDDPRQLSMQEYETCIRILSNINAPFGKYWVYGNHDHGGYGTETIKKVMELSQFRLLMNESTQIVKDDTTFNLAGLDDVMLGRPSLDQTLSNVDTDKFTVLMCHEPDFADLTKAFPVDVQFSGHSHGGQIQIPFIGYVVTPPFAEKYVEGNYTIGNNPLQLFVTRGIGTTRLPYRFLCKPEINLFTLHRDG